MISGSNTRWTALLLFVAFVAAFAAVVWRSSYMQALSQLSKEGEANLELASDRLTGKLQRYQELVVLLAEHPTLAALLLRSEPTLANALLLESADKTAARNLIYAWPDGTVLAAADASNLPDMANAAYFQRAMQGALGSAHGVDPTTGDRAFYFAAPSFGPDGRVTGALAVVVDVNSVEFDWSGAGPAMFFTDASGEVFISNRPELVFWSRDPGEIGLHPPSDQTASFASRVAGDHEIWALDWSHYVPQRALHLVRDLPVIGMRGEALIDVAPAQRLAWLQAAVTAAVCMTFGALLFLATERRRTLAQANAQLETRVAARTQELSDANIQLRREITEREEAEAALKKAQADLVQAGKLSALGQMSAGISHELNQPLMAIETFADNAEAFIARDKPEVARENLSRISQMARRMARIIKNLRAFARQETEPMGRVDMVQVVETALELTAPRLERNGVSVDWAAPPAPIWVMGGEVRLGQVLVNLITNATDAMTGQPEKALSIRLEERADCVAVEVADTGPGIEEPERIFDPFYTTKEIGGAEGMGLGLSISYGLVQSFGGVIRGRNRDRGGAVFTVELTPAALDVAA